MFRTSLIETLELRRLFSALYLDPTFGQSGTVSPLPGSQPVSITQPDGKVIRLLEDLTQPETTYLERLTTAGKNDPTFGSDGFVHINGDANLLALGPTGEIVTVATANGVTDGVNIFDSNGTLLGSHGDVIPSPDAIIDAVAVTGDGKVILAGGGFTRTSINTFVTYPLIARFNIDGSLDSSFFSGRPAIAQQLIAGISLDSDGRILVVPGTETALTAFRLNADGSVDTSFNASFALPLAAASTEAPIGAPLIQPDGRILLEGNTTLKNGLAEMVMARFNADGTLDSTFVNGILYPPGYSSASANALSLSPDGSIALAINVLFPRPTPALSGIFRITSAGIPDTGFGVNGLLIKADVSGSFMTVGVLPDGRIVAMDQVGKLYRFVNGPADLLPNGTLQINGTPGNDTITVGADPNTFVVINGTRFNFSFGVYAIVVNGGAGDDLIQSQNALPRTTLMGGLGNDVILDGNLRDDPFTGDALYGGPGDDSLSGGAGNDFLNGGIGDNVLRGNGGNDTLVAGGPSSLFGGAGNDTFFARNGAADSIIGGLGQNSALIDPTLDQMSQIQILLA